VKRFTANQCYVDVERRPYLRVDFATALTSALVY